MKKKLKEAVKSTEKRQIGQVKNYPEKLVIIVDYTTWIHQQT